MITKLSQNEDFTIVTKGGGRIAAPNIVAEPQFNPTAAYAKDAKVWYGSISYICTSATTVPEEGHSNPTPEEDTAHWSAIPVEEMAKKSEVDTLLFSQYYPDGSVKSAAEFTPGIKYDDPDTSNRTITVKTFCNNGTVTNNNSNLSGRVVIPPFVDAQGNGYISNDGTRYKVSGITKASLTKEPDAQTNTTGIVAPTTVLSVGDGAFYACAGLASVSLPAAETVEAGAFGECASIVAVSLPSASGLLGDNVFAICKSLRSVYIPYVDDLSETFIECTALESVDFGDTPRSSVPSLSPYAFSGVPTSCRIIVPDAQYDAWTAPAIPDPEHEGETIPNPWYDLVTAGYKFLKHSEWEYARKIDATLTPVYDGGTKYGDWELDPQILYHDAYPVHLRLNSRGKWEPYAHVDDGHAPPYDTSVGSSKGDSDSVELSWTATADGLYTFTATRALNRVVGYTLGTQTGKPLQPQGNYVTKSELAGKSYNLSDAAGVVRALEDIITALGGEFS